MSLACRKQAGKLLDILLPGKLLPPAEKTPLQESDDCGFWILASLWCHFVSPPLQGLGCTPWRPSGVPLVPFGLRRFCVAGVAQRALPRGRVYALASLWRPSGAIWSPLLVPAAFAWQAWHNMHCHRRFCVAGVAQRALARGRMYALVSFWRPSGVICSPPLLRGRRGTTCIGKGSDVRPDVPLASLWCHLVSAALRGRGCTTCIGKWHNVHCQGVGCTPWRPSGVPLVWQAWHNVHWQGSDVCHGVPLASHWCHLVSALLPGRRGTTCIAKGSYVRPGVALASLWCRLVSAALIHSLAYTTLIHRIHTLPHAHTHTYIADTHTQTHVPLLQPFKYFCPRLRELNLSY